MLCCLHHCSREVRAPLTPAAAAAASGMALQALQALLLVLVLQLLQLPRTVRGTPIRAEGLGTPSICRREVCTAYRHTQTESLPDAPEPECRTIRVS
jgi:hypothetical protein